MKMKILEIINLFSPYHGGSAEAPYYLSKELVKLGHQVTIYTSDYKLKPKYPPPNTEVNFRAFKTWLSLAGFQITPGMINKLANVIRGHDVIHLHNYRTFQNILAHYYTKKFGVPYVLQAHGSLPRIISKQRLKQLYDNIWGYRLLQDASKLIALTPIEFEQYKSLGISEDKIQIVPNGIDLSEFERLPQRGKFRRKYNLRAEENIILYLARLHKIKSPDLLVRAFADINKKLNNAKLVLIGSDEGYLPLLKKLIRELGIEKNVIFTGPLYGNDKLEAYVDADIYVLPSVYETFPLTVLEAIACGTPVILTHSCGVADIINHQAGLVVAHDRDQIGNAILQVLGNNKMRYEFAERGKSLVREKFNWSKIVSQVEDIYLSCLS